MSRDSARRWMMENWSNYMDEQRPMPVQYRMRKNATSPDNADGRWIVRCTRCKQALRYSPHWDQWKEEAWSTRPHGQWKKLVFTWCNRPECQALNFLTEGGDHNVRDQTNQPAIGPPDD